MALGSHPSTGSPFIVKVRAARSRLALHSNDLARFNLAVPWYGMIMTSWRGRKGHSSSEENTNQWEGVLTGLARPILFCLAPFRVVWLATSTAGLQTISLCGACHWQSIAGMWMIDLGNRS